MWWLRGSVGIWGIYPIVPTIPFPLFTYRPLVWYELMWFVYIELCCFPWGNHPGRDDPPPRSVNRMAAIAAIGSRLLSPSLESKREWRFLRSSPPPPQQQVVGRVGHLRPFTCLLLQLSLCQVCVTWGEIRWLGSWETHLPSGTQVVRICLLLVSYRIISLMIRHPETSHLKHGDRILALSNR